MKNILIVGKRSKNIPTKVQKHFWMAENQVYLWILANLNAPGYGSAFSIRIRIQDSKMNEDLGRYGTDLQHWPKPHDAFFNRATIYLVSGVTHIAVFEYTQ